MSSKPISAAQRLGAFSARKTDVLKRLLEERSRQSRAIRPYSRSAGLTRVATSWAQQRLWFIDQLDGGSLAYHIAVTVHSQGKLHRQFLCDALDALVQRHEVLRTVLVREGGEPRQEIRREGRFALQVIDLRGYEDLDREAQLRLHEVADRSAPFDLKAGPLVRGRLLQLRNDEHVLFLTMHHIVSDGWSMGVMIRELATLYRACAQGQGEVLPPLPIQYADYAQWQREAARSVAFEKELAYWRQRLGAAPPQLELPTDRPRPAVQTHRGGNYRFELDPRLTADLRGLAQRNEMTLFMVLYAAWSILMFRLSGQRDVVVGTPVANRQRPELEGLIGFFVNTLALRVEVQPELELQDFFKQVKALTLAAFAHQDLPFERVVEALQPERSLSRNPLFQVMLALQNAPKATLELPELAVTVDYRLNEHALFDLLLSLEETGDSIRGVLNYATDLYDRETMQRWMDCLVVLLRGMVANERRRVGELPILTPAQRRSVIEQLNATRVAFPCDTLIHELFEQQVERTPDAVALVYNELSLTYVELNHRANQLARFLRERGAGVDHVVGVCVDRSIEMVVSLLGVLKAGAGYLPLDPSYPAVRLQQMLEDAAPEIVLTQQRWGATLGIPEGRRVLLDEQWGEIAIFSKENISRSELPRTPRNLLYLIYTSGSTGKPKGTAMSHRAMVNLIEWHRQQFQNTSGQRVLQFAALSFDVAFQEAFSTLCLGGTLLLLEEWIRKDPRALTDFLTAHSVQRAFMPPLVLQSLAEYAQDTQAAPSSLRDIVVAGEQLRISPEIRAFFARLDRCRLHNHYGPTETHVVTALTLSGDASAWPSLPAIGQPIANTQIYILDEQLRPVPMGVTGEVYVGGENVARGYRQQPDRTAQRFLADPFGVQLGARMYRTGDLGRWKADGTIEYLGRNDHQVKIRGFRIELGEIEAQLAAHAEVKEVVVIAREDVPGEKRLVAYVTAKNDHPPKPEELRAHLKSVLPGHMIPSAFVALNNMPVTPSGKLDRRTLPAPRSDAYVAGEYQQPQGEVEERLARIWKDILRIDRVGRHDNFFELGGHSLHGMKLAATIGDCLGVDVSVLTVFQHPTVEQMARAVRDSGLTAQVDGSTEHPPLAQSNRFPLAFSQLAYWNLNSLGERKSLRQVAFAMRVRGRLHIEALRESATEVVRRHSALRTRLLLVDDVPVQEIREQLDWDIDASDLTALPEEQRESQLDSLINRYVTAPVDVRHDPLFGVALFQLRADEHVLVVAMEHLISDAFSVNLFLRELLSGYGQRVSGKAIASPPVPLQFPEYALAQRRTFQSWSDQHGNYWRERLAGLPSVRFPTDLDPASTGALSGWATVPVHIGKELMERLRAWARLNKTTLVLSICTAYIALVHRLSHGGDVLIQFQTSGRTSHRMESSIGFFASVLYLRVGVGKEDRFGDLLERVAEEYCNAYAHADAYYFASQTPRQEFTRTSLFNWVPLGARIELSELADSADRIEFSPASFSNGAVDRLEWDNDPMTVLFETEDGIVGGVNFPRNRFSAQSMQRFGRNFSMYLQTLVEDPETRVPDLALLE